MKSIIAGLILTCCALTAHSEDIMAIIWMKNDHHSFINVTVDDKQKLIEDSCYFSEGDKDPRPCEKDGRDFPRSVYYVASFYHSIDDINNRRPYRAVLEYMDSDGKSTFLRALDVNNYAKEMEDALRKNNRTRITLNQGLAFDWPFSSSVQDPATF